MNVGVRLLYAIATMALFPALISLIPIASGSTASSTTWWTFAISWAVVIACLGVEWRRDRYAVAMFGTVFSFLVTMVAGSLTVLDGRSDVMLRGGVVAVLAAAILIACITGIVRERRMTDEVPDHLLGRLGPGALFETEGVVWGATAEAAGGDLLGVMTVFVQCNVAAPRTVRLELEDVAGFWGRGGALSHGAAAPFELEAGGLACCSVPVAAGQRPAESARLYLHVRASGPPGRRIRKHRGRAATRRTTTAFRLFALLGGHIVWGGGVHAAFQNPPRRTGDLPPPPGTWRTLAAEDLGTLAQHPSLEAAGLS